MALTANCIYCYERHSLSNTPPRWVLPIVCALLAFLCTERGLFAQDLLQPVYSFEHLSQEQGLSYNTVTSFAQDTRGFLWIATFNGLNRYDGTHFKIFNRKGADSTRYQPRDTRFLYADRRGDIWVVSYDNTLERFNPRSETFSVIKFAYKPTAERDYINSIMEDASGVLWLTTIDGLFCYDRAQQTIHPFEQKAVSSISLLPLGGIIEQGGGSVSPSERRLWIRKRGGLIEFDPVQRRYNHFDFIDTAKDKQFFYGNVVRDSSGFFWLTDLEGLYCFDPRSKSLVAHVPQESYIRQSLFKNPPKNYFTTRAAICAPDGMLWFGSNGGIVLLRYKDSPKEYETKLLQSNDANPTSLSGDAVRALFVDKSGVIWVGGEPFGINKYTPYRQKFQLFRYLPFDANSLANNYVRGICQDHTGVLWVATHFGGISRYNPQRGVWTRFRDDIDKTLPRRLRLPINEIWSIFEDRFGVVWAGTRGKGLLRFDKNLDGFVQSSLVPETAYVQVITEDRAGNLLLGTRGNTTIVGVFIIPPDRKESDVQFIPTKQANSNKFMTGDVLAIHEDRFGALWVGGTYELLRITRKNNSIEDFTPKLLSGLKSSLTNVGSVVTAITEDRAGTLWVSSKGGGVGCYDRERDCFLVTNELDGLPNNSVYAMLEDNQGRFWISSDAGLTMWDRQKNTFRSFTTEDGLQGREYNRLSYFKSTNGTMFFGGTNGLNAFHPDHLLFNPFTPPLALTSLHIFDQEVRLDSLVQNHQGHERIVLNHDQNFLTFRFAALDFHVPQNNLYAHKLEGVDRDWIHNGTKHEATYTNLNPGEYTFRVRGANSDGVWNMTGLTLHVIILPPWWQTWWFRVILIFAILGVLAAVLQSYRLRIQHLQEHREELLRHIEERRRAEDELQHSEEKFRALFETSPLGMVLWQVNGSVLEVNAAFTRISGYAADQTDTLNFWDILNDAHSASIHYSLQHRNAFGPVEQTLTPKTGEKLSVVLYGIAIAENPSTISAERIWTVIEDVTERKRALDAMLRYQLNPHFMFNVLNSVNALMGENQRNAKRMIIQFSSLLRHTLVASSKQTAPLGDEIEAVEHYLAIEKLRYEERLEARIDADRRTLDFNVPVFLVQPLVENAIKYGMQTSKQPLELMIVSRLEGEYLIIEVANTGSWVDAIVNGTSSGAALTKQRSTGIGLENLRKRLAQLYPNKHTVEITHEQGIVRVRLTIMVQELLCGETV